MNRDFANENEVYIKADTFKCGEAEPWTARPLHSSVISGREYAIQVSHPTKGIHHLQCDSQGHVERWLAEFHQNKCPDRNNKRRHATQLELWVSEAKGLPTKNRRYFAELCFDEEVYARTAVKEICNAANSIQSGSIVWGEYFEFPFIPEGKIENIRLHVYRNTERKKSRKDRDYIGLINIPISSLTSGQFTEKWFPLSTPKAQKTDTCSVRMKARYQSLQVLPLELYKPFAEYLTTHYLRISQIIGPAMSAGQKERVAGSMVRLMMDTGKLKDYLTDLMELEVKRLGEEQEALLFRENSIGSKSIESFLKLVCRTYLSETLQEVVKTVIDTSDEVDCEVDKERLSSSGDLKTNRDQLTRTAYTTVCRIMTQRTFFPNELREVYVGWRERVAQWGREDLIERLVAGSLFLRLLCPALLTPSLFHLAPSLPSERASRTLTLTAKIVQSMANGARFGNKEDYLAYLNPLLDDQREEYQRFINDVTNKAINLKPGFEGHVDLGLELAKLQQVLNTVLSQNEELRRTDDLRELRQVVESVKDQLESVQPLSQPNQKTQPTLPKVTPRKEGPLSFQNPSFAHSAGDKSVKSRSENADTELIPVGNLNHSTKSESHRHLFDVLEDENNYLQESLALPRSFNSAKDDRTRNWLEQHQIQDATELIQLNEELESKVEKLQHQSEDTRRKYDQLNTEYQKTQRTVAHFNEKEGHGQLILERCISLEKDIQTDRRQMQQIIDAKQRLIEKQSLRITHLENKMEKQILENGQLQDVLSTVARETGRDLSELLPADLSS